MLGWFILVQILLIYSSEISNNELVSVAVIFRHGDRTIKKGAYPYDLDCPGDIEQLPKNILRHGEKTIVDVYPNDPYHLRYYWPEGYGQLTNKGKMQMYQLGQWFRKRYDNFLSEYYTIDDVHVLSSGLNRAIMSAESFLAGLFPPVNEQVWNPTLKWQPIPVHTVPLESDNLFLSIKFCPKYNELRRQFENSPAFLKMQSENQDLYAFLSIHMGHLVTDMMDAAYLYDTLNIENDNGYTLPNWTKTVFPSKLKPLFDFSLVELSFTPEMARFQVGPLLDKIASQFENRNKSQKFKVYSGHDMTLVNFLNSFGLYEHERPPYGAAIIIELFFGDDDYFVNILYKDGSVPRQLKLYGCEFDCPLDKFREIIQPLRLDSSEWNLECFQQFQPNIEISNLGFTTATWGLVFIIIILLITIVIMAYCNRRNKKRNLYVDLEDFESMGK